MQFLIVSVMIVCLWYDICLVFCQLKFNICVRCDRRNKSIYGLFSNNLIMENAWGFSHLQFIWCIRHVTCLSNISTSVPVVYHAVNKTLCLDYREVSYRAMWTGVPKFVVGSPLTHWGAEWHLYASRLTIIGSDNGLSPLRRQAIIWTSAGILLISPLPTNFSEILIEIHAFFFKKIQVKMSPGKWWPLYTGLSVLKRYSVGISWKMILTGLNPAGHLDYSNTEMLMKPLRPVEMCTIVKHQEFNNELKITFLCDNRIAINLYLWHSTIYKLTLGLQLMSNKAGQGLHILAQTKGSL